ncbi:MAG: hypothetical protein HQL08_12670 [Nitrospirae bacterium]|nr:hypothetical protein [Nitrospirota bacterium]
MNLKKFLIIVFLNVIFLSGCAFTTETMKLDNSYSQEQKTIDSSKKISAVQDKLNSYKPSA